MFTPLSVETAGEGCLSDTRLVLCGHLLNNHSNESVGEKLGNRSKRTMMTS